MGLVLAAHTPGHIGQQPNTNNPFVCMIFVPPKHKKKPNNHISVCIYSFRPNRSVEVVSGLFEVSEEQLTIICVVLLPPDKDFSSSIVRAESRKGT